MKKKATRRACRQSMPTKELLTRRFHSDVRKLKQRCTELNLWLKDIGEAQVKDICVISTSDYEIGSFREDCSKENENWFLSIKEYERLLETYPEYKSY